jgi:hypothetical protein
MEGANECGQEQRKQNCNNRDYAKQFEQSNADTRT